MHDLIVIGAGLAGLSLAQRMARSGANVLVLEARERTGGRVFGHTTANGTYDLGPAWVWPEIQPMISAALAAAQLPIFPQDDNGGFLFQDNNGTVQRLPHGFAQSPTSMRLVGGISALLRSIAQALPPDTIRLSHRAVALASTNGAVTVDCLTSNGPVRFSAAHVALAMPPRLIAALSFDPALPHAIRQQLASVPTWMAGHAKALAIYDDPFWRRAGLSGAAISRVGPLGELHDASLPGVTDEAALFGFFAWPSAIRATHQATLPALVTAQLGALFGKAGATPRHIIIHDWANEALTATLEDQTNRAEHSAGNPTALPEPWRARVSLCGSENAAYFGGYLEGALQAAVATADQLITGAAASAPLKPAPSASASSAAPYRS